MLRQIDCEQERCNRILSGPNVRLYYLLSWKEHQKKSGFPAKFQNHCLTFLNECFGNGGDYGKINTYNNNNVINL